MEPTELRSDSRRKLLSASPSEVFAAMSDPARIARWWGPSGFTNTIGQFDFRPGGQWLLTMHGPDGKDYPNESRFTRIVTDRVFEIEHLNQPHFLLTIELVPVPAGTELKWQQTFDTVAQYQQLADFVASANEQNLERLAAEVQAGKRAPDPTTITVETVVHAPVEEVWRAWTTPDDIKQWNAASDDWHTTQASVDLRVGGAFSSRMEARDGSMGFDFAGSYTQVIEHRLIESSFGDRTLRVEFLPGPDGVTVRETFAAEPTHSIEQQRLGWQAILDNFARHVERLRRVGSAPT